jgi:trans-aconitate 2-methyltransferase
LSPREWDAGSYERLSDPQLAWGRDVLDRLVLRGDESVLDAGCGTGRVTALLAERLPRGRVIAVDGSEAMAREARERLGANVDVRVADLLELELAVPVDAILSTATFHWITDHDRLFARLRDALAPGGRLVAQCGGEGNVEAVKAAGLAVGARPPFREHLGGWSVDWYFAGAEETERRLRRLGFAEAWCWTNPEVVEPEDPAGYLRAVCLGSMLERLPEPLHEPFVAAALAELGTPLTIHYVRLNILARRPSVS